MRCKALIIFAVLALAAAAALAAEGKPDARVSKLLGRLHIDYSTTDTGNFSIDYDLGSGRKQTVYIMSETETYGSLEIREIWTNAGNLDSEPSSDDLMQLLQDNNDEKIGAWSLESSDDGGPLAYFSVKVPTYLKDKDFSDMIQFVAQVGDAMERKLFDADDNQLNARRPFLPPRAETHSTRRIRTMARAAAA
jgi:hypothetical protein